METKTLLVGIISFMLGGLVASTAATTLYKPNNPKAITMAQMTADLRGKTDDAYDAAFIAGMIEHHQGAIDMARYSATQAKHDEIKTLSQAIITAQEQEIKQMREWQKAWGYSGSDSEHSEH